MDFKNKNYVLRELATKWRTRVSPFITCNISQWEYEMAFCFFEVIVPTLSRHDSAFSIPRAPPWSSWRLWQAVLEVVAELLVDDGTGLDLQSVFSSYPPDPHSSKCVGTSLCHLQPSSWSADEQYFNEKFLFCKLYFSWSSSLKQFRPSSKLSKLYQICWLFSVPHLIHLFLYEITVKKIPECYDERRKEVLRTWN